MAGEPTLMSKCAAEFVGTFMLVFAVGCNVLTNIASPFIGVSIGCTLMVAIYALGKISGGNFNPAVSLSLGFAKACGSSEGLDWKTVGMYVATQVVAAVAAACTYSVLFWDTFTVQPAKGFSIIGAGLCELLYTFMLCFVVLNCAASTATKDNQWYALAIGFSVIAGAYGAGAISGGCFNPAVAIGIDLSSLGKGFGWSIAYTICECLGAGLATAIFMMVRPDQFPEQASQVQSLAAVAPLIAEFVGTFMLVLTAGLCVLAGSPTAAFAIAACLMCMIYALGDVSGAHFNPAVTVAAFCTRRGLDAVKACQYIVAQVLGGIAAAFSFAGIYGGKTFDLGPMAGHGWAGVGVAELFFTFVLCFTVLCTAVAAPTKSKDMFGLAIGSCVTVGGYAVGGVSGGCLNPAVAIGLSAAHILGGGLFWKGLVYSVFEFAGGVLAAGLLQVTHPPAEAAKNP